MTSPSLPPRPVAITDEIRAAAASVFGLAAIGSDVPAGARVGALVFYPLVGAAIGAIAGVAAWLASPLGAWPSAVAAVLVLAASSGGSTLADLAAYPGRLAPPGGRRERGPAGIAVAAVVILGKLWAVARIPEGGRMASLVLASMLGRWAVVVGCYGGSPGPDRSPPARLLGRAQLREFGWASTIAFGVTLAALDAVGLLVLVAATLTSVGIRVLSYHRAGYLSATALGASVELVEAAALLVLAALARG